MTDVGLSETSGRKPPSVPPKAPAGTDEPEGGFPPELYAPAVEGPVIHPKLKPRIVREES